MSFLSQNTPKSMLAGALPQTPLGSLQRSPDLLAGFKGLLRGRMGMERRNRWRRKGGKGGVGKGGEKEEAGGNSTLVVRGIDAPASITVFTSCWSFILYCHSTVFTRATLC